MPGEHPLPLLVGWGNALRGDDGAGVVLAERLRDELPAHALRVVVAHQLTPDLAEAVSAAAAAVFVDASCAADPGAVACHRLAAAPALTSEFTHHCQPADLLRLAHELYGRAPASAWLVTIGGASFGFGEELSPRIAAALPRAHALVTRLLSECAR